MTEKTFTPSDAESATTPAVAPALAYMRTNLKTGVLIVEDQAIVAKDIAGSLGRLGYRVAGRAMSGEEAVRKADDLKPDLILMDVHLQGDVDGIRAAQTIKSRSRVAIVYLTASSDVETVRRAMDTEPLAFLVKPFREPELCCAIEVALSRHRLEVEAHEREEMLRSVSLIDEATGLLNRRGFFTLAGQQLKVAGRIDQPLMAFFADLDDLKHINDDLGHPAGDQAIGDAANVLRQTFLRESDLIGRLGGDEFVILVLGESAAWAEEALTRLGNNLESFNRTSGRPFRLAISVGVAVYSPGSGEPLDALLARADRAMYQDKRRRKEGSPPP